MSKREWFDKLENLILDENRTMSYKTLSRELNVHINKAKEYLCEFLTVQSSKSVPLKCTYFLSGITEVEGIKSIKVFLVNDDSLEKTKLSLSKVTSCHIYSVGRGKLDECSLYGLEKSCNKNCLEFPDLLPIKHPNIVIKAPVLNKNALKNEKLLKQSLSTQKVKSPMKNELPQPQTSAKESESSLKSKTEPKKSKPNALTSMWQKNEDKQKGKNETVANEKQKPKTPQKNKQPTPKNSILSMFSRQTEKAAGSEKKISPISSTEKEVTKPKDTVKNIVSSPVKKKNEPKSSKSAKRKSSQRSSKKGNDNDSDEDVKPSKKKHRRICTFEDSDSESESEEALDRARRSEPMDESPIPATPLSDDSEEPIPPTPPVTQAKGKKKLWKSVQKTYEDEDGFFVTKQEKVLVSESDSDGENPIPKKSPAKEIKKTNQVANRKQASLTQFFKQK